MVGYLPVRFYFDIRGEFDSRRLGPTPSVGPNIRLDIPRPTYIRGDRGTMDIGAP